MFNKDQLVIRYLIGKLIMYNNELHTVFSNNLVFSSYEEAEKEIKDSLSNDEYWIFILPIYLPKDFESLDINECLILNNQIKKDLPNDCDVESNNENIITIQEAYESAGVEFPSITSMV